MTSPEMKSSPTATTATASFATANLDTATFPSTPTFVRNRRYSDSDAESLSLSDFFQMAPDSIHGHDRDLSLLPESLARAFRRIRPIPAGLTPPRMPRITNYSWGGAGDWVEAAGIGETIRSDSPWSSMEAEVMDDIFRPVRSFADARFLLADQLNPFVDEEDESILSVDSYGNALTPLNWGPDEMRPRGRARPGARPPSPQNGRRCLPRLNPMEMNGTLYILYFKYFLL